MSSTETTPVTPGTWTWKMAAKVIRRYTNEHLIIAAQRTPPRHLPGSEKWWRRLLANRLVEIVDGRYAIIESGSPYTCAYYYRLVDLDVACREPARGATGVAYLAQAGTLHTIEEAVQFLDAHRASRVRYGTAVAWGPAYPGQIMEGEWCLPRPPRPICTIVVLDEAEHVMLALAGGGYATMKAACDATWQPGMTCETTPQPCAYVLPEYPARIVAL